MGLFKPNDPPNTVSDQEMADLRRRAVKANPRLASITDPEAIRRRLAANEQHDKRTQSLAMAAAHQQPPGNGPFTSRQQAETVFAAFRQAAETGRSGPPGEQLTFTTRGFLAEALGDTIEDRAEIGDYDWQVITRLAQLLDPVEVGVVCSWIYRAAKSE